MKSIISASIMASLLVCLAIPGLVLADAEGASAGGSFKFALDDGETRFVEFKASELGEGQASGEMTFSDPAATPVLDPDDPREKNSPGVLIRAKFDCMETTKNTAVMGGEIFESNVPGVIGLRVLLVVEDNGVQGADDKLAWGIYQQPATGWIPVDAERDDDKGAFLNWIATDFERKDDVGIPMPANKVVACRSFPLASYDFPAFKYGGGDLLVQSR
jgi:hypothetical protein